MNQSRFRLSDSAQQDIDTIWQDVYALSQSLVVADKIVRKLYDAFNLLGEMPQAGHIRADLTTKPLKFWSIYSYLIVYKPEASPIEIVAVIHGARDLKFLLSNLSEASDDLN